MRWSIFGLDLNTQNVQNAHINFDFIVLRDCHFWPQQPAEQTAKAPLAS
jgi:hypothetical protein